jgi:hypothetical protein
VVVEDQHAEADVKSEDDAGDGGRALPRGRHDREEGE